MLKNRVIIVVGGAGLLGRSLVLGAREQGARVVVADLDRPEHRSWVESTPGVRFLPIDICSTDSVRGLLEEVHGSMGSIDGLVNTAYPRNRTYGADLRDVTYESFCENVSLHLGGYFLVMQQASFFLAEHGGGSLVSVSSVYGLIAPRFDVYEGVWFTMPVEYAAIKAGLNHLVRYFAAYFKGKALRINSVSPGGILNGQDPRFLEKYDSHCLNKGMLAPQDVVGTVVYLLSDASRYVNGQNIVVDDGFSL